MVARLTVAVTPREAAHVDAGSDLLVPGMGAAILSRDSVCYSHDLGVARWSPPVPFDNRIHPSRP